MSNTGEIVLGLALGLAVLGGSIAFGLAIARRSQQDHNLVAQQVQMGFAELGRRTGLTVAGGFVDVSGYRTFPVLSGRYRHHPIRLWFSSADPDSYAASGIAIWLEPRPGGGRWLDLGRLERRRLPAQLSSSTRARIVEITNPERLPCRVLDLEVRPRSLSCVVEHMAPEWLTIEGRKVRPFAEPTDLGRVLDALVLLAAELPVE